MFQRVMAYPEPRPRNIEKDLKVFPWANLEAALGKCVERYIEDIKKNASSHPNIPLASSSSSSSCAADAATSTLTSAVSKKARAVLEEDESTRAILAMLEEYVPGQDLDLSTLHSHSHLPHYSNPSQLHHHHHQHYQNTVNLNTATSSSRPGSTTSMASSSALSSIGSVSTSDTLATPATATTATMGPGMMGMQFRPPAAIHLQENTRSASNTPGPFPTAYAYPSAVSASASRSVSPNKIDLQAHGPGVGYQLGLTGAHGFPIPQHHHQPHQQQQPSASQDEEKARTGQLVEEGGGGGGSSSSSRKTKRGMIHLRPGTVVPQHVSVTHPKPPGSSGRTTGGVDGDGTASGVGTGGSHHEEGPSPSLPGAQLSHNNESGEKGVEVVQV